MMSKPSSVKEAKILFICTKTLMQEDDFMNMNFERGIWRKISTFVFPSCQFDGSDTRSARYTIIKTNIS
jgi:hypothetical protein